MHDLSGLKMNLEKELGKLSMQELDMDNLKKIHTLTDTIKNICKIEMLGEKEEGGYSNRGSYGAYAYDGYSSYDGYSTRRGRDSMGRFVSRDSEPRYSRSEAKESMMHQIDELIKTAANESEKVALRRCMSALQDS